MTIQKTLIILLIIVGSTFNSLAQESIPSRKLDSLALKMFHNFNDKDYDALVDMTHPKLFDIVPKESMVSLIKSMLEGTEELTIEIPKEIPDYKISNIFKDEEANTEYAFLSYNMKMTMTFLNQDFDEEGQEMMKKMMKAQGMEVEFIAKNSINAVIKNSITIFLKDDTTNNNWYMLNYDADSPLLYQLLTTSIIEKTRDYKQNLMLESNKTN